MAKPQMSFKRSISPSSDPKRYALTAAERLHLDIYGYVIIHNVLTADEIGAIAEAQDRIERDYWANGEKEPSEHMFFSFIGEHGCRIDNLPALDPAFKAYLTHPRIVGFAEDAVGGSVRLEQSDVHVHRPSAPRAASDSTYGWHRGWDPAFAFKSHGLTHFPFMKCLTNLTDLGPDDGGTSVIAGSHKMADIPQQALIAALDERPEMRHQVVAPAGSTLVFFESTIHSAGINRSGKLRRLIIGGYSPDIMQPWFGYDPDPAFIDSLPESEKPFFDGRAKYGWTHMRRDLKSEY